MSATKKSPPNTYQNFPVVGIGASAGGLDAFKKLLQSIDESSGMAYVLIQHLDPDHDSLLPEILAKSTVLPVYEIADDINLAPNNVYIIPENKILTALDGVLKLHPRDLSNRKNMPIDIFFKSIAEVHKSFAIGTVLSGTGFDGTEGLKHIKEMGGVTYAQDPDTAVFDGMPKNAVNSGAVDFILPPEDIAQHLQHIRHAYKINHAYADDLAVPEDEDEVFRQIIRLLRLSSGNDFSHYKQPTLRRRIARRMVSTKNEEPQQYLKYLKEHKEEQDALFNDVLIPVSYFFRDTKTFDILPESVFPLLLKNKKQEDGLRIWTAGCSTGEEAFSLAICLHEFLAEKAPGMKIQLFASDISERGIAKARTAIYGKQELQNVSEERLQNYFTQKEGSYRINKVIRDMCVFATHNFLKDPPFAKMDLISCRNVLIYFNPILQKKALATFHYALQENGILFLGKSESVNSVNNLFEPLIKTHKIFIRKSVPGQFPSIAYNPHEMTAIPGQVPTVQKKAVEPDYYKLANSILFTKYTPAGVVINDHKDIIHFHGDTSPFLVQSPGKPTLNILKMAREGLAFELRNALLKGHGKEEITKKGITIKGADYLVDFTVIPLSTNSDDHSLVLFHKINIDKEKPQKSNSNEADQRRIMQLEAELDQLRDDIRSVTEAQEAANEELQSANEELVSSSEELQSLNEELETSAEELQSNNEELISVNDELMERHEQLSNARVEAEAIVETIREPLVILDSNMRIKSANDAFYSYFKLNPDTMIGVSIFDVGNRQWYSPELRLLLENILPEKSKVENFEITGMFSGIGQRTLLINARRIINKWNPEELVLLAFDDVTERNIAKILLESDEQFRNMANNAPVLLWLSDDEQHFTFFNKSWLDYTGRTIEQEQGIGWTKNLHPEDRPRFEEVFSSHFRERTEFTVELRVKRNDGEFRWMSLKGLPRFASDGKFIGYVGGGLDIHDQKFFADSVEGKVQIRTKEFQDSEAFLQSILNTTQNLIYLYDFEKEKIVFINKKAFETTGYTSEEIENSEEDLFTKMIHQEDLPDVVKQRRQLRESSDGKMHTVEFRIKNRNGEWTCQLSRDLVFKRDDKGNAVQYIGVATDISERKSTNKCRGKTRNLNAVTSNLHRLARLRAMT